MRVPSVAEAVGRVFERIAGAAERSGRDPGTVRVVAITKGVAQPQIEDALEAGISDLGENRPEDLDRKSQTLDPAVRWHLVGGLQTRKIPQLDRVLLIHSLDRQREAEVLNARGEETGRSYDVLIQVNAASEPQKQGIAPDEVEPLLEKLPLYPQVKPRGFMFMAPLAENPEDVRWVFAHGRRLRERYSSFGLDELSMGMSDDYEVAVEEGATIVRIGRAIFASEES
ncbi:MAG: YggS family pyridoxal phosphate-dependent enzyme [Actinomycetota bacterium]